MPDRKNSSALQSADRYRIEGGQPASVPGGTYIVKRAEAGQVFFEVAPEYPKLAAGSLLAGVGVDDPQIDALVASFDGRLTEAKRRADRILGRLGIE